MTKHDLVRWVSGKTGITFRDTEVMVDSFFQSMADGILEGKRVEIRGFGTFSVKDYDGYLGRNPRSGEPVTVPPKRLPCFKPGKHIRDAVDY